jgi:putative serine protease PepD
LLTAVALLSGLVSAGVAVWATRDAPSVSRPVLGSPTSGDAAPQDITDRPVSTVAGIAGRVLPSVVSVEVRTSDGGGTGSGFVIDDTGYVLTNNHVVEPAADADGVIKIVLADERRVDARIVGRASTYDLAVLKVTKTDGLVPARLGDSDAVAVGDPVVAIGSPLGLAGTVTSGIISATERPVSARRPREGEEGASNDSYISALQTDAAINPGNSGGPLVDGSGKVVGVNTAIATLGGLGGQTGSIGLGFAIPINQARRTAQQLIETGEASFPVIGASVGGEVAGRGAQIADGADALVAGGPAERAGLRPGDVIVAIDGDRVNSSEELIVEIRSRLPGDRVTLTYERGGQQRQAQVTLGASQE